MVRTAQYPLTRNGFRMMAEEIAVMRRRIKDLALRMEDAAICGDDFAERVAADAAMTMTEVEMAMAKLSAALHN